MSLIPSEALLINKTSNGFIVSPDRDVKPSEMISLESTESLFAFLNQHYGQDSMLEQILKETRYENIEQSEG